MNERIFTVPSLIQLVQDHDTYWENTLLDTGVLILDADEDETGVALTLSTDLPYRTVFDRYQTHVANCSACLDTPVWDVACEEGLRLGHACADVMAAQEETAAQN